ncbi:hypothetical protein MMC16_000821 [Acarospora aff. strigata]|nr:hypothetical protein [Acarospora aff. strigata]
MDRLPNELLFYILNCMRLQAVSQRLFGLSRDDQLWKLLCFNNSQAEANRRRREILYGAPTLTQQPLASNLQRAGNNLINSHTGLNGSHGCHSPTNDGEARRVADEKTRALANWDPSYSTEKVDWYGEYIVRHAPLSMTWLQQPSSHKDHGGERREVRGIALLEGDTYGGAQRVVAPLDDGSVCLWDIGTAQSSSSNRQGSVVARSKAGLLSVNGQNNRKGEDSAYTRAQMTSTGVVECVSVDSFRKTAYFAVQSGLNEVDLETLQIISHERYPFSISALSEATYPLPLTVGTTLSLHLHDPRFALIARSSNHPSEFLDPVATFPASPKAQDDFHRLLAGDTLSTPAPLFQPGPLSILHLDRLNGHPSQNSEIFVAGRFPSILNYDRRFFPRLRSTIHSGARLCSLTSLPHPFRSTEQDLTRQNQPSPPVLEDTKAGPGSTLIACGEYNGKGSLEMYGLRSEATTTEELLSHADRTPDSTFKNRVSASRSKLLSVATHGTSIVSSDSDGGLKWVERDGSTLVRRWNINEYEYRHQRREEAHGGGGGLFPTTVLEAGSGSGDVARKILTTNGGSLNEKSVRHDNLLLWNGERIGLLKFASKPDSSEAQDLGDDENGEGGQEVLRRREERIYGLTMRRALERQADEVRFVRGLGLGGG